MSLLIVAATPFEIAALRRQLPHLHYLVTGIGQTLTAYSLTRHLAQHRHTAVLNLGIAGCYQPYLPLGSVVQVVHEQFADLAYELPDGHYRSFVGGPMLAANEAPFVDGALLASAQHPLSAALAALPAVRGITVNKVNGAAHSITLAQHYYAPQVESMEGAAVFYICHQFGLPVAQVRSISNRVEPRDTTAWNIPLAIKQLNEWAIEQLTQHGERP